MGHTEYIYRLEYSLNAEDTSTHVTSDHVWTFEKILLGLASHYCEENLEKILQYLLL